ncbi:MAG: RcpC/CpaB family pilus assembly protein, partial [Acidimicrobiia bacterium]
ARSAVKQLTVPDGMEALAVSTPFDAGGACYIAPGDIVNVYQVFPAPVTNTAPGADPATPPELPYDTPRSQLVLTNVTVLDVNCQQAPLAGQTPTTNAQQAVSRAGTSSTMTVVLALTTAQTEKAVFGSTANNSFLYFSLLPENAAPAGETPGRDFTTQFQP